MGRLWNESTVACVTHQHSSTAFPETVQIFDQLHIKGCEEVALDSKQMTINRLNEMMANYTITLFRVFCFFLLFFTSAGSWRSAACTWCCGATGGAGISLWATVELEHSGRRFSWSCQCVFQSGCVPVTGGLEFVDYLVIERRNRLELVKNWLSQWRSGVEVVEHYVIQRRNGLEFVEHCVGLKFGKCLVIQRRNSFVSSHFRGSQSFRITKSTKAILIVRPEKKLEE